MDFKVLIADSAIADLKQIVEFVAEDNPEAAIRLGEKLLGHACRTLFCPADSDTLRAWQITNSLVISRIRSYGNGHT